MYDVSVNPSFRAWSVIQSLHFFRGILHQIVMIHVAVIEIETVGQVMICVHQSRPIPFKSLPTTENDSVFSFISSTEAKRMTVLHIDDEVTFVIVLYFITFTLSTFQ